MKNEFITAITALAAEKNLPKEVVFDAVETALASAYKKDNLAQSTVVVKINADDGTMQVFTQKAVVDEVEDDKTQMTVEEARQYKADAAIGDAINFEAHVVNAGRIAAQTAKQVVLQRLREAERDLVYEEYAGKEGEIVSGVVQRLEGRNVIIDLGRTEAVLPPPEQVRMEHYRATQRLKVLLIEVFKAAKGPQVVVSRTHKDLLRRLFELEVPEIFKGIVEIKSIAREAGYRSKVAVWSRQEGIDPVGACVGMRGIRIQNVVNELGGERIDVVQWDPEQSRFVANALSPAQVVSVVNFDIHLRRDLDGRRYIERITECVPVPQETAYPEAFRGKMTKDERMAAFMETTLEYFRRSTDRPLYTARNLVEYRDGRYVAVHPLSEQSRCEIAEYLSGPDQAVFDAFLASHWGDET